MLIKRGLGREDMRFSTMPPETQHRRHNSLLGLVEFPGKSQQGIRGLSF